MNKSKVFSLRVFFVVVVGVIAISLFLPVYRNYLKPTTAKAANDNDPVVTDYQGVYITPPLDFYFSDFGVSYPGRYMPVGWRFFIYNSPSFSTGGGITTDMLYTINGNGTYVTNNISFSSVALGFFYTPPLNNTASKWYNTIELTTAHLFSETVSGRLTSYEISIYKHNNVECGISIRFNFQTGYKIYNLYNTSKLITFVSSQTFPRLYVYDYTIASDSEITRDSYNKGKTDGYNIGYDAGKSNGRALGYQEGYNAGRQAPQYSFSEFFAGFGAAFLNIWNGILNFEFLGVNIMGLIGCVLVVALVLIVLKIIGKA